MSARHGSLIQGRDAALRFFIVDDDSEIIEFMTALLEAAGHSVSSSVAGAYALAEITAEKPDCVLADLMMAEMDGLELCRALRGRAKLDATRFIVVSARDAEYWRARANDAGADGYIVKPLDPATFVAEIERLNDAAAQ
jgi:DNA-binding response OmpR family regulator